MTKSVIAFCWFSVIAVSIAICFAEKLLPQKYPGVAQSGSATVLGTVGREFESHHPDIENVVCINSSDNKTMSTNNVLHNLPDHKSY